MLNFTYHNPVKVVFGKGTVAEVSRHIAANQKILLTFGGGSIQRNGVYDKIMSALQGRSVITFGGIEPNPRYETLMNAVEIVRQEKVDFLLSVGGGSVLDGTKFIAAAVPFTNGDPWDILAKHARVRSAVPLGCVLTLPATGSEMNAFAVISRASSQEKLAFASSRVFPQFSILDPETTFTLDRRQSGNGVVDAFAHVFEQYMTYPVNSPLQDRQAEAILLTLIAEGPKVVEHPDDYDARANVMWCAASALNGVIACGAVQDWATHTIGHELTAFYGIDHAQSLAVVFPGLLRQQRKQKQEKLLQYAERVWGLTEDSTERRIEAAIARTESFFRSLGVGTRLSDYGISRDGLDRISSRISKRDGKIGERKDIGAAEIDAILTMSL
jgi:NADP-dependent alcohol dehydrogenase